MQQSKQHRLLCDFTSVQFIFVYLQNVEKDKE